MAIRFTTVFARVLDLLPQLVLRPRRHTARVPLVEHVERLIVGELKAPNDPTTDAEGPGVAAAALDSRLGPRQETAGALGPVRARLR